MMRHLIIFTRAAQLGRVKRRLAADIGALAALRFHRAMQTQLLRGIAKDVHWKTWLAMTPDFCTPIKLPGGVTMLKQGQGDLGQRMAHCFRALPPGPAVLVGSDIPGIGFAHIASAFAELGCKDTVFGPANDGGYWLVGLKRLRPIGGRYGNNLFSGVRWSSPYALSDTLATLGPRTRTGFVKPLSDVDNAADYDRWRRSDAVRL